MQFYLNSTSAASVLLVATAATSGSATVTIPLSFTNGMYVFSFNYIFMFSSFIEVRELNHGLLGKSALFSIYATAPTVTPFPTSSASNRIIFYV